MEKTGWEESIYGPWLDGVSGPSFRNLVEQRRRFMRGQQFPGLAMAKEKDPVAWLATVAAAILEEPDLLTGNPHWSGREWDLALSQTGLLPSDSSRASLPGMAPDAHPSASRPRILVPTGGTTGGIRLAVHTPDTLVASARAWRFFWDWPPEIHLCVLPLHHVSGLMQVIRVWVNGGRLRLLNERDLLSGSGKWDEGRAVLSLVPTQLRRILKGDGADHLRRLQGIFLGGAPASPALLDAAASHHLPIVLTYGMTETAAMVCAQPVAEFHAGRRSAGRPLIHADVRVLDEQGGPVPAGTAGRLHLRCDSLFHGYCGDSFSRPEKGGWWPTGDRGRLDGDGFLHIEGRLDDVINSGGEKVSASFLEKMLMETGWLEDVVVTGVPDEKWGQRVVCFYQTAREENRVQTEQWLGGQLSRHFMPKEWIRVESMPRNDLGKPDRPALLARLRHPRE